MLTRMWRIDWVRGDSQQPIAAQYSRSGGDVTAIKLMPPANSGRDRRWDDRCFYQATYLSEFLCVFTLFYHVNWNATHSIFIRFQQRLWKKQKYVGLAPKDKISACIYTARYIIISDILIADQDCHLVPWNVVVYELWTCLQCFANVFTTSFECIYNNMRVTLAYSYCMRWCSAEREGHERDGANLRNLVAIYGLVFEQF